jgi:NADH-quinone oxidoreductase subunit N
MGALTQLSLYRIMGYASINQMGFMVIGLGCNNFLGVQASLLYLIIYLFSLVLFIFLVENMKTTAKYLTDLSVGTDIEKSLLTLVIFSMAGLPPFVGFVSKYVI